MLSIAKKSRFTWVFGGWHPFTYCKEW